jgi:circadian clock protein KaiC
MNETNEYPRFAGICKVPTGIPGVDEITGGGIPSNRTTLVMGGPGSGKTIFALQTLVNGAREHGEPGIFVAFEENSRHIIENAGSFGWDLPALEQEQLFFLDARMPAETVLSGDYDLAGMLASLQAKAREMGAKRIVFDSIDVLLTLLGDAKAERLELYRIHDWLADSGLTGIITTRLEGGADPSFSEHFGFMQFMADCVVLLGHHLVEHVSLRELRVLKYRGTGFAENEFPLVITPTGIEVASAGVVDTAMRYPVFTERISTGISRLDTMLGGDGYIRGTSILITGSPGTAKTTLGGAFVQAACERGERAMLINFDESAEEVVRNLTSVNIRLQRFIDDGLLQIHAFRSEARSAEEHLICIKRLLTDHQPNCLVVDPLSALLKAGGHITGPAVAQRLLSITKQQGITSLCTSLLGGIEPVSEASPLHVSTIADTWIHLSYLVQAGERNRALTFIKSRGTGHSNQVRELVLSQDGLTLSDVYTAGGAVLMGSMRTEKEALESLEREQQRLDSERRQRELQEANAQAQARIANLQREMALREEEMARVQREQTLHEQEWATRLGEIRTQRGADLDTTPATYWSIPPAKRNAETGGEA